MTGADYIASFLARIGSRYVYTLTGGACAFMLDAVSQHPNLEVICVQNEQAAAMAADATWRVGRRLGVTMATSGPGATNLITGIACSFFDSVPSIHITGQVNQRESSSVHGAAVRQSGFQETKIVEMVRPITKYAVMVRTTNELKLELEKAYKIATTGRMGPVLIDVPMDVQQASMTFEVAKVHEQPQRSDSGINSAEIEAAASAVAATLSSGHRPVILWGGGVAMAGVADHLAHWLETTGIPFVSSWAGLSAFDHRHHCYLGQIGVYGNRGANFVLQNADTVVVLGSRLDNRQRSGNADNFARGAIIHVIDIDGEELRKFGDSRYRGTEINLSALPAILERVPTIQLDPNWLAYTAQMKASYFGNESSTTAQQLNTLSPYEVVRRLSEVSDDDAIIIGDTGAALCWLHQAFLVRQHNLFTAGGNSPMGYALCAAIGAKLEAPERQVIAYNGDGGFQVNIQELQTIKNLNLDVAIVIMNNNCYGIIKQFQDSYLGSRYVASSIGYSQPDFARIADAYGFRYIKIENLEDLVSDIFDGGPVIVDIMLSEQTLIEPKLEMGRPINDQYPYLDERSYADGNRYVSYPRG